MTITRAARPWQMPSAVAGELTDSPGAGSVPFGPGSLAIAPLLSPSNMCVGKEPESLGNEDAETVVNIDFVTAFSNLIEPPRPIPPLWYCHG
jgi:hypothetical protein